MSRGIYIIANDRVMEQAIALLNSIRFFDPDTPIVMIPYNNQYQAIANIISQDYGGQIYENSQFLDELSNLVKEICGDNFFDRPNLLRKLACWFGPFEEFLYIDTDIVVFEKIIDNLNYLADYDFICCDYQHLSGIQQIFTAKIQDIFTEPELKDVFNSGFWGSKKSLLSQQDLYEAFKFCANNPEYFFLDNSDQTILNYLILKQTHRRLNLARQPDKDPGTWAGSGHFQQQGDRLIDPNINQPLKFVHWAGIRIEPGGPYWDIWQHYRYLNTSQPPPSPQMQTPKSFWQRITGKMKPRQS